MRPEPSPEIVEYIRTNRAVYTREAIDRELREAGHGEEAIDAAWQSFPVEVVAEPPPRSVLNAAQFWVLLFVVACVAIFLLPFVSLFFLRVFAWFTGYFGSVYFNGFVFVLVAAAPFVLGYLGVGVGAWRLRHRDQAAAYGMLSGLVAAFVFSIIVVGTCVAILVQM